MSELNLVWVLSSWQIVVDRYPRLGERVKIGTIPYEIKGCLGQRNFAMYDEAGERVACANSLWTLLNTTKMTPAKATPLMLEKYPMEEKLDMDYAPRKIAMPAAMEVKEEIKVKKYHLDTNNHVNNGQYVRMAMDFLPENAKVVQLRAEYKKQALLDDRIVPVVGIKDDVCAVALKDTDGATFANVEFTIRPQE